MFPGHELDIILMSKILWKVAFGIKTLHFREVLELPYIAKWTHIQNILCVSILHFLAARAESVRIDTTPKCPLLKVNRNLLSKQIFLWYYRFGECAKVYSCGIYIKGPHALVQFFSTFFQTCRFWYHKKVSVFSQLSKFHSWRVLYTAIYADVTFGLLPFWR